MADAHSAREAVPRAWLTWAICGQNYHMIRYQAYADYDGRFWCVRIPEVGWSTQVRLLHQVEPTARELVAEMSGAGVDSVDVAVHVVLPEQAEEHLRRAEQLQAAAEEATAQAAGEIQAALHVLRGRGLPIQDIGQMLNVPRGLMSQA